jgi:hypothetical protein
LRSEYTKSSRSAATRDSSSRNDATCHFHHRISKFDQAISVAPLLNLLLQLLRLITIVSIVSGTLRLQQQRHLLLGSGSSFTSSSSFLHSFRVGV